MLLTLAIGEVLPATPRARIVRIELGGAPFDYMAAQAILVGAPGGPKRPYSMAASPEETRREGYLELLVGVDANGTPGPHLPLERGRVVDVNGPLGTWTFPSALFFLMIRRTPRSTLIPYTTLFRSCISAKVPSKSMRPDATSMPPMRAWPALGAR